MLDVYGWWKQAMRQVAKHPEVDYIPKLRWYTPFWVLYVFMAVLQVQYAQSALGIGLRYRWLNRALRNQFLSGVCVCVFDDSAAEK